MPPKKSAAVAVAAAAPPAAAAAPAAGAGAAGAAGDAPAGAAAPKKSRNANPGVRIVGARPSRFAGARCGHRAPRRRKNGSVVGVIDSQTAKR
jgi:hypothetical protein